MPKDYIQAWNIYNEVVITSGSNGLSGVPSLTTLNTVLDWNIDEIERADLIELKEKIYFIHSLISKELQQKASV